MIFKGTVVTDFITEDEKNLFLNFLNFCDEDMWESAEGAWDRCLMSTNSLVRNADFKIVKLLIEIRNRQKLFIEKNITMGKNIYSDGIGLVRWPEGQEQPPHVDDMSNTDVPGFDHRMFGSILYLNDNYDGGEIYYPDYRITIKPTSRSLAIHPGDLNHVHGVTKIKNGIRYTIALFWTYDQRQLHELY